MKRRTAFGVAVITVGVLDALAPAVLQADPYNAGPPDGGRRPDNEEHTFCRGTPYNTTYTPQIDASMDVLDGQTAMSDTFVSSCTNLTDVIFQVHSTIGGARGDYVCNAENSVGNCERATVRLAEDQLPDAHQRWKTACHEVGHSAGLQHGDLTDCMRTGTAPAGFQYVAYNDHHVSHINARK